MNKIIVPTDFSPDSENAFSYAMAFAAFIKQPVLAVHITHPGTFIDTTLPAIRNDLSRTKERKLAQFVSQWKEKQTDDGLEKVIIEQKVILGFPTEELVKLSKLKDSDFIIMGTTGTKGALNNFLGTISSAVSRKAYCPVWLIPSDCSFSGIDNILYAGNYESANKIMLDAIINVSDIFDAMIHLVHINNPKKNSGDWKLEELFLEQLFRKKVEGYPLELHTVQSDSFWEGINKYVAEKNIDMIVMVTRHRRLWESLWHKSMVKTMIVHAKVSLLVLHIEDEILR